MFKKLLSIAAIATCIAVPAVAQDYSIFANPVDSTTTGTPVKTPEMEGYPYIELANHLTNTTANNLTISWKVISVSIPSGWKVVGMCDNNTCYSQDDVINGVTTPPPTSPIPAGGHSLFDLRVYAPYNGTVGTGTVKVRTTTLNQTDTLIFIVNKTPTGISTIKMDDKRVSLYPNPATSKLQIFTDKNLNATNVTILNISGNSVLTTIVEKNNEVTDVNINTLAAGTYMVRVNDSKGEMIATRKFIKK